MSGVDKLSEFNAIVLLFRLLPRTQLTLGGHHYRPKSDRDRNWAG